MPRPLRADFADTTYHVINRANARMQIFATLGTICTLLAVLLLVSAVLPLVVYATSHRPLCDGTVIAGTGGSIERSKDPAIACKEGCKNAYPGYKGGSEFKGEGFIDKSGKEVDLSFKCCCKQNFTSFEEGNPLGGRTNIPQIIGSVIRATLGIIGTIALIIFIYGGFLWMVSMGEEDRIKRGRETMIWAGLGLITIFGAYTIVEFIIGRLLS